MSSGLLRAVLDSFIMESRVMSSRISNAKQLASSILESATESDEKLQHFDKFEIELHEALQEAGTLDTQYKLHSTQRKKAWIKFRSLRTTKLKIMWVGFLKDIEIGNDDTGILIQHVNLQIFEKVLMNQCHHSTTEETPPLTDDEASALRYAAGYVPFALRKKLKNKPNLEMCLDIMAEQRNNKDSGESKKWLQMIDRGGLFKVNNQTFSFFVELELKLRHHLATIFNENAESHKETIIDSLMSNDDLLFAWIFVSRELDEDESNELLHHVIEIWLTVRGFSAAGAWMEYYKQNKKVSTKGKHALRKELAKKNELDEEN